MKIPVYNCEIDETDNITGIYAMSFVESPANESRFVAMNQAVQQQLSLNKQKQILSGVVLKPDQLIYREDDEGNPYYIRFSAKQIEQIAAKMMRRGLALYNTTHQHEEPLSGNYLVELWTVSQPQCDKSLAIGLGEQAAGTLCASYKITDSGYWRRQVLSGNIKGFSIEGFFNQIKVNMNKQSRVEKLKKRGRLETLLRSMGVVLENEPATTTKQAEQIADEAKKDATESGTPLLVFELADGNMLEIDNDGFATINGEQAPTGVHKLTDGNLIAIDDNGFFVATQPETEGEKPSAPNAELSAAIKRGKTVLALCQTESMAARVANLEAEITRLKAVPSAKPARAKETQLASTPTERNQMVAEILGQVLTKRMNQ